MRILLVELAQYLRTLESLLTTFQQQQQQQQQ